jgi:RimJ/RimL family protein N-acetyltransferase
LCSHDAGTPVEFTFAEFQERFSIELDYPGLTCTLAIDTLENKHIGECSLFNLDFLKASVEIGIIIGEKSYWERGYGTDAVSTFVAYIFETSDVEKIMLRTLEWNVRAQKCFEKCGFKRCGSATRDHYNFILMEIDRQRDPKTAQ